MVRKKRQSKRVKLKDQHKIRKKVAAHHKKIKKELKKNPDLRKKVKQRKLLAPNTWPVKQEFLNHLQKKQLEKDENPEEIEEEMDEEEPVEELEGIEPGDKPEKKSLKENKNVPKKAIPKKKLFQDYLKIIQNSDIIIEVLDARDPVGSRSKELEKIILEIPNKFLILLVNKIDLVARDNLVQWLDYLRKELPTIAFRSTFLQEEQSYGTKTLVRLLQNYKKNSNIETNLTVGIIGYPNVGKKAVIKSFKGHNKTKEGIILSENITLLHHPGTFLASVGPGANMEDAVLRNATEMRFLPKPFSPIKTIVQTFPKDVLLQIYKIPYFDYYMVFLRRIITERTGAKKFTLNEEMETGRQIYEDWKNGKIPYYTELPDDIPTDESEKWKKIVNQHQIIQIEKSTVFEKLDTHYQKIMFSTPIKPLNVVIDPSWLKLDRPSDDTLTDIIEGIPRRQQKKIDRNKKRRAEKKANEEEEKPKAPPPVTENYDFQTDFK